MKRGDIHAALAQIKRMRTVAAGFRNPGSSVVAGRAGRAAAASPPFKQQVADAPPLTACEASVTRSSDVHSERASRWVFSHLAPDRTLATPSTRSSS